MTAIERILVPIDFSEPSMKALDEAVEFNQTYDAEIVLMTAVERSSYESPLLAPDTGALLEGQAAGGAAARGNLHPLGSARHQVPDGGEFRRPLPGDRRCGEKVQGESDHHVHPRTNRPGTRSPRERRRAGPAARRLSSPTVSRSVRVERRRREAQASRHQSDEHRRAAPPTLDFGFESC